MVRALLAQLDRVAHYECEGLGFESLMARHKSVEISTLFLLAFKNDVKMT